MKPGKKKASPTEVYIWTAFISSFIIFFFKNSDLLMMHMKEAKNDILYSYMPPEFELVAHHNMRWNALPQTNLTYQRFIQYIGSDIQDGISRGQLREHLALYLSDDVIYLGMNVENRFMEFVRHYFGHKTAKDFLVLTGQQTFTKKEVQLMFERKALLNYMNDLVLAITDWHKEMANKTEISFS